MTGMAVLSDLEDQFRREKNGGPINVEVDRSVSSR
jgi:hypothetical protein